VCRPLEPMFLRTPRLILFQRLEGFRRPGGLSVNRLVDDNVNAVAVDGDAPPRRAAILGALYPPRDLGVGDACSATGHAAFSCCASASRAQARSKNSSFSSMPMKRRPVRAQAMPVVPEPIVKSSTTSPGWV